MKAAIRRPRLVDTKFGRGFIGGWIVVQLIGVGGYLLTVDPRIDFLTFFIGFGLSVSVAAGAICGGVAWLVENA